MSIAVMKSQRRHSMTTHDEKINTTASVPADQPSSAPLDSDSSQTQPAPSTATDEPAATASSTAEAGKRSDRTLFAKNDLSGLRSRWDDVQVGFVDDPKDCVQKADAL